MQRENGGLQASGYRYANGNDGTVGRFDGLTEIKPAVAPMTDGKTET